MEKYSPQKHEEGTPAAVRYAKSVTPGQKKKLKELKDFRRDSIVESIIHFMEKRYVDAELEKIGQEYIQIIKQMDKTKSTIKAYNNYLNNYTKSDKEAPKSTPPGGWKGAAEKETKSNLPKGWKDKRFRPLVMKRLNKTFDKYSKSINDIKRAAKEEYTEFVLRRQDIINKGAVNPNELSMDYQKTFGELRKINQSMYDLNRKVNSSTINNIKGSQSEGELLMKVLGVGLGLAGVVIILGQQFGVSLPGGVDWMAIDGMVDMASAGSMGISSLSLLSTKLISRQPLSGTEERFIKNNAKKMMGIGNRKSRKVNRAVNNPSGKRTFTTVDSKSTYVADPNNAIKELDLIATGRAKVQRGHKKALYDKFAKDGTAAKLSPQELLYKIETESDVRQKKAEAASRISMYKSAVLQGKKVPERLQQAFNDLTPENQTKVLADIEKKKGSSGKVSKKAPPPPKEVPSLKTKTDAPLKTGSDSDQNDARQELELIATGRAKVQRGHKKALYDKYQKDGTAQNLSPEELLDKIVKQSDIKQKKAEAASRISLYKSAVIQGKKVPERLQMAYNNLSPEEQAKVDADIENKKRKMNEGTDFFVFRKELEEAKYQGKDVPLNKPMKGDVKKSKVYVKDPKTGNVKKVNFGDKNMSIKKDQPGRKKSYCARSGGIEGGGKDKTKANYWSRRAWDC